MTSDEWKDKAERLFFIYGKSTVDIAAELRLTRQTVAHHLRACPGYEDEQTRRRVANAEKRQEYKRNWARLSRGDNEKDSLRREHFEAVKTLSVERHF